MNSVNTKFFSNGDKVVLPGGTKSVSKYTDKRSLLIIHVTKCSIKL